MDILWLNSPYVNLHVKYVITTSITIARILFPCYLLQDLNVCWRSFILQHTRTKLSKMSDNSNHPCDDDWLASSGSEEYEEEELSSQPTSKKKQKQHSPRVNRRPHKKTLVREAQPARNLRSEGTIPDLGAALSILQSYGLTVASNLSPCSTPLPSIAKKEAPIPTASSDDDDSNSEDDDPPEEETTRERAARLRGAARARVKRAKDLVTKRRKAGLKPYVAKIDAYGKQKGLHSGLWTTMVRAQGKRLDCSIDNLRGHPPGVIDSIFHTLCEQFEFQGFTEYARPMFEKHMTKYLKNRRYKYTQALRAGGKKPADVSSEHWENLISASKIPRKAEQAGYMATLRQKASDSQTTSIGKRVSRINLHTMVLFHKIDIIDVIVNCTRHVCVHCVIKL